MREMWNNRTSRRQMLGGAAAVAAGLALGDRAHAADKPYGPFKMGIQSYSLRGYKFEEALAKTRELGLHYWESFSAHIPLTTDPAAVSVILEKLKAADVNLSAHGVTGFGTDAAANRRVFEAAKALGVRVISADPDPKSFDQLEMLVDEFKISIAIHNHGPGSRYDKLQQVVDAVKDRHPRIGACADLGHFLRSSEHPVKVIEALNKRIHGIHLKDVKDARTFTILGQGDLPVLEVLKALRAVKYSQPLSLEYEENPQDPIADIQACLRAVQDAVQRL